jgi:hypothetical protein
MATYSSLAKEQPRLQAVFGLLSAADDDHIRSIFRQTDANLLELARHFGIQRAGWEGSGLELVWGPSGYVGISSYVGTGLDGSHCVDFLLELTPTWVSDTFPNEAAWEIEAFIQADCQHQINHRCMEVVHMLPTRRESTPIGAALALKDMAAELLSIGTTTPLKHWLQLAGDEQT